MCLGINGQSTEDQGFIQPPRGSGEPPETKLLPHGEGPSTPPQGGVSVLTGSVPIRRNPFRRNPIRQNANPNPNPKP